MAQDFWDKSKYRFNCATKHWLQVGIEYKYFTEIKRTSFRFWTASMSLSVPCLGLWLSSFLDQLSKFNKGIMFDPYTTG